MNGLNARARSWLVWLLPFAVTALPAFLAIYTALGFALARTLWTRGPLRILTLALTLTIGEWLRGRYVDIPEALLP